MQSLPQGTGAFDNSNLPPQTTIYELDENLEVSGKRIVDSDSIIHPNLFVAQRLGGFIDSLQPPMERSCFRILQGSAASILRFLRTLGGPLSSCGQGPALHTSQDSRIPSPLLPMRIDTSAGRRQ